MMPEPDRRFTGQERRIIRGAVKKKRLQTQPGKFAPQRRAHKCPTTSKIKWVSQLDALMAIANRDLARGSNSIRTANNHSECRAYQCPDCECWHTTHIREHKPLPEPVPKRAPAKGPHPAFTRRDEQDQAC